MEIFCIIYYICSYIVDIPAIIKLIKTKKSNDYSIIESILTIIGVTSWTLYIFSTKQSILLYIGTIIDEILILVWYGLVIKYFKRKEDDTNVCCNDKR